MFGLLSSSSLHLISSHTAWGQDRAQQRSAVDIRFAFDILTLDSISTKFQHTHTTHRESHLAIFIQPKTLRVFLENHFVFSGIVSGNVVKLPCNSFFHDSARRFFSTDDAVTTVTCDLLSKKMILLKVELEHPRWNQWVQYDLFGFIFTPFLVWFHFPPCVPCKYYCALTELFQIVLCFMLCLVIWC